MTPVDGKALVIPSMSLAELVLRGSLVYLLLFFVLRLLRRDAGALSIADLLVVVLIADAAQNALGREYRSVTEGAALVATIAAWNYFLDGLGFKFPRVRPLLRPAALVLVKDGRMQRRKMRQELITEEELMSQLRQHGVDDVRRVKRCCLEEDGHISVITRRGDSDEPKAPPRRTP